MESRKIIKLGALLLALFAAFTIAVSFFNLSQTLSTLTDMSSEDAAMIEAQLNQEGTDLNTALTLIKVVAYTTLAVGSILSVIKIVIGVLILKNADRSNKFYMIWNIIFLIFGLWGLKVVGFTILGLCHFLSGIVGPLLLIVGSCKLKKEKEAVSEPASESDTENQI